MLIFRSIIIVRIITHAIRKIMTITLVESRHADRRP
jgi:hypothetical protein